ncbi:MAG TPA: MFS transporter [Rhizomicrobium sp.]
MFYYAGFVAGCLIGPRVLARVGHIRTFAVAAALAAAAVLLQSLLIAPAAWFAIRAAFGFCAANVFMALESWLNDRATNQTRGRVLSAYVIVNLTFLTLGQWLLLLASPSGFKLFTVAAIAYICCLVPVGLTKLPQPAPQPVPPLRVRRLMRMAPVGVAGVITVGLANGAFWTLAPVYAQLLGFRTSGVAAFMSAFIVGGALIQIPLAKFSDRLDRRWIMALACAIAALFGVALAFLGRLGVKTPALLFPTAFVFGAAMLPLYSLSIAHANDRMERRKFVEASATLLLINALASVIGPILAAVITAWPAWRRCFSIRRRCISRWRYSRSSARPRYDPRPKRRANIMSRCRSRARPPRSNSIPAAPNMVARAKLRETPYPASPECSASAVAGSFVPTVSSMDFSDSPGLPIFTV